jgi:holo-[acyl-carrier protein] synthase
MIIGIGIDSVEIARFEQWHTFTNAQLLRIFNQQEIDYCLEIPVKRAERFAARFAAREAFFKALSASIHTSVPFLTLCKAITVAHTTAGAPLLHIQWALLAAWIDREPCVPIISHLSLTHTKHCATALVILEK